MYVTSTNSWLQVEDFSNLDGYSDLKAYGGGGELAIKTCLEPTQFDHHWKGDEEKMTNSLFI